METPWSPRAPWLSERGCTFQLGAPHRSLAPPTSMLPGCSAPGTARVLTRLLCWRPAPERPPQRDRRFHPQGLQCHHPWKEGQEAESLMLLNRSFVMSLPCKGRHQHHLLITHGLCDLAVTEAVKASLEKKELPSEQQRRNDLFKSNPEFQLKTTLQVSFCSF